MQISTTDQILDYETIVAWLEAEEGRKVFVGIHSAQGRYIGWARTVNADLKDLFTGIDCYDEINAVGHAVDRLLFINFTTRKP